MGKLDDKSLYFGRFLLMTSLFSFSYLLDFIHPSDLVVFLVLLSVKQHYSPPPFYNFKEGVL